MISSEFLCLHNLNVKIPRASESFNWWCQFHQTSKCQLEDHFGINLSNSHTKTKKFAALEQSAYGTHEPPPMVAGDINESRLTGFWRLVEYLSGWQKNPNEYNVHVRRSWKKSLFVPSKFIVICYILQMNSGQLPSPTSINPAMGKKLYQLWNTTMQNFSI